MATQDDLITGVKEIVQSTEFTSARILSYLNQAQRNIAGGMLISYPDRTQVTSSPLPLLQTDSDLTTSITLPYIDTPSDYGRNLYTLVSSTTGLEIEVMGGLAELLNYYQELDKTFRVTSAAIRGKRLYYQGMPGTAETLTAFYHRNPYDMNTITGATDISFATNTITDVGNGFGIFHAGQTIDVTGTTNNNDELTISSVAADGSTMVVAEDLTTEANQSATIKSRPDGIPVHLHESLLETYCAWKIFERKMKGDIPMEAEAKRYHGLFLGSMLNMESVLETVQEPIRFMNERW